MKKFKLMTTSLLVFTLMGCTTESPDDTTATSDTVSKVENNNEVTEDVTEDNHSETNENEISDQIRITTNITDINANYFEKRTVEDEIDFSEPYDASKSINPKDGPQGAAQTSEPYNKDNEFIADIKQNPERYFSTLPETTYAIDESIHSQLNDKSYTFNTIDEEEDVVLSEMTQFYTKEVFSNEELSEDRYYAFNTQAIEPNMPKLQPSTYTKLMIINKQLDNELSEYYQSPSLVDEYHEYDKNMDAILSDDATEVSFDELINAAPIIFENDDFLISAIFNKEYTITNISDNEQSLIRESTFTINNDNYNQYLKLFESKAVQQAFDDNL